MKKSILLIICISFLFFTNCTSTRNFQSGHFTFKKAYYQSWISNENENGTDVVIELSEVLPGIHFNSIVFRGFKIPVSKTGEEEKIVLKGVLVTGLSKLDLKIEKTEKPNQLIYTYEDKNYSLPLENIERKETSYQ